MALALQQIAPLIMARLEAQQLSEHFLVPLGELVVKEVETTMEQLAVLVEHPLNLTATVAREAIVLQMQMEVRERLYSQVVLAAVLAAVERLAKAKMAVLAVGDQAHLQQRVFLAVLATLAQLRECREQRQHFSVMAAAAAGHQLTVKAVMVAMAV